MTRAGVLEWRSAVLKAGLPEPVETTALALSVFSEASGTVCVPERKLAREMGRSRSAVWSDLKQLQERGLLRRAARTGQRAAAVYVLQFPGG